MSTSVGRDLRFVVDLNGAQAIIQVLDRETGELIREIPANQLSTYALEEGTAAARLLDAIA
jgi:uncharacterized FlaG/YvyC family protein